MLYAIPFAILAGWASGGRVANLGSVRLRLIPLIAIGLLVQFVLFTTSLGGTDLAFRFGPYLYMLTVVVLLGALVANLQGWGAGLLALGGSMNLLVIAANGGQMPVSADALRTLGGDAAIQAHIHKAILTNVALMTDQTWLPFLGDLFPMPAFLPAVNVFSVGDVVAGIGIVIWIVARMRVASTPDIAVEQAAAKPAGEAGVGV